MRSEECRLGNGTVTVAGVYRHKESDKLMIKLDFKTDNGAIEKTVVIDYQDTNSKSRLLSDIPDGFYYEEKEAIFYHQFKNFIQSTVDYMEIGTAVPYGYSEGNGNVVYNFGGELINQSPGINVLAENPKKYTLNLSEYSSRERYDWMYKYITQNEATAALHLSAYSTFIQPLLSVINLRPVNAYCCGESGYGKSEEAKLQVSFFEGTVVGCNLGSDKSVIMKAYADYRGLPFLIDDLNKSPSRSQREKREEKLSYIIQSQSSAGEIVSKDITINSENSGLIITAEYTLDNSVSTMNRCVLVKFEKPFEDDVLTWLQKNKQINVSFLYGFVAWICKNMSYLKKFVSAYPFNLPYIENMEKSTSKKRIKASYHSLYITKVVLLMYMKEAGIVTKEEQSEMDQVFDIAINKTIEDTVEVCQPKAVSSDEIKVIGFFLDALLTPESSYITKDLSEYYEDSNYLFFKRKGFYSFKGSRLLAHLEMNGIEIDKNRLTRILNHGKLIKYSGSEPTYKLPKEYGDKTRFYHTPKEVKKEFKNKEKDSLLNELGLILDAEENMKEWGDF